jgi:hypothetical protein
MKLTIEQIAEIAKDLQSGLKVFVNTGTMEKKNVGDWENDEKFDENQWKDTLEDIESNPDKYIEIERLPQNELLAVMEGFVDSIEDEELKKQLELILTVANPFLKFREIINKSPDYKSKWAAYKNEGYIDWIRSQLHHYNLSIKKTIE